MREPIVWSRREFVKMAAMTPLSPCAVGWNASRGPSLTGRSGFALVSAMGASPGVRLYEMGHGHSNFWRLLHTVPSAAPVAMAFEPSGQSIYVLQELSDHGGIPRGSVETYRVDRQKGTLALVGCEPLSLSATLPRSMAISPDGNALVVAVHGGGSYNLLPILPGGGLGRVRGIFKETGSGPVAGHQDTAHPQAVVFAPGGQHFVSVDLGLDRLSLFSIEDGLRPLARYQLEAGSGPGHVAIDPKGELIFVAGTLNASLTVLQYDTRLKSISKLAVAKTERHKQRRFGGPLAVDGSGDFLFSASANAVHAWRIDAASGMLAWVDSRTVAAGDKRSKVEGITVLDADQGLLAVTSLGVVHLAFSKSSGRIGLPAMVAELAGARSITLL